MIKTIDYHLKREGYSYLKVQPNEAGVYYRYVDGEARVVIGINAHSNFSMNATMLEQLKRNVFELFLHPQGRVAGYPTDCAIYDVRMLTVIVTGDSDLYRTLCSDCSDTWICDTLGRRLIIYENQPGDFYGLRAVLQDMLENQSNTAYDTALAKPDIRQMGYINISIILVNAIVFFSLSLMGDVTDSLFMYSHGAMYPPAILQDGEVYRLFTAMFLHFGAMHLVNNMVMLAVAGKYLEKSVGHIRFALIYLLSGLCGNMLSFYMMNYSNDLAVSAGASGAVFGVVGALLFVAFKNHGKVETLTTRGLIFMIALCMYYGLSTSGVDNWCHLGGLLGGLVICALMYLGNTLVRLKMNHR